MRTVDKLEKIGPEKVREILTSDLGVRPESAQEILDFIAITGGTEEIYHTARRNRRTQSPDGPKAPSHTPSRCSSPDPGIRSFPPLRRMC